MVFFFACAAYALLASFVAIITIGIIKNPPIREIKRLLKDLDEFSDP